jgi:ABC-type taurine transport system ATPase subunit
MMAGMAGACTLASTFWSGRRAAASRHAAHHRRAGGADRRHRSVHIDGVIGTSDRDIAMVFQSYALYPHMTVFENMAFGLRLRKTPEAEIRDAAVDGAAPRCCDRRTARAQARCAVGRPAPARGHRPRHRAPPKVFLFDEPLSNLDAKLRGEMRARSSACTSGWAPPSSTSRTTRSRR